MPVMLSGGGPSPTVSIGTIESPGNREPWLPPPKPWSRVGVRPPEVGDEDDGARGEEHVDATRRLEERRVRVVSAPERLVRRLGAVRGRGEVEVREVVDEEVEAVTGYEPAADRGRI